MCCAAMCWGVPSAIPVKKGADFAKFAIKV